MSESHTPILPCGVFYSDKLKDYSNVEIEFLLRDVGEITGETLR